MLFVNFQAAVPPLVPLQTKSSLKFCAYVMEIEFRIKILNPRHQIRSKNIDPSVNMFQPFFKESQLFFWSKEAKISILTDRF